MLLGVVATAEESLHPVVDAFFGDEDTFIQNTLLPNLVHRIPLLCSLKH